MQAVILAGGLGTRLGQLTKAIPKPMVPIFGVPYLEYQLRLLAQQNIRNILLLTGYLGDRIEGYFGCGERLELSIQYSREQTPLGTGGALRQARDELAPSFLLIYGDSYLPIDYVEALRNLDHSDAQGLLVVYDNRLGDTSVKNNVAVDDLSYVIRYEKDSADPLGYVEAGVLAFRREIVDLIPDRSNVSLETEIFPKLIGRRQLLAYITTQRFYDIGTPERLQAIGRLFAR